jgi:ABC-type Fe3+/spermidine/putrescine transport system ATPase subunit
MIQARGLVKRYGATAAVNDFSFTIRPGMVTGFLGPNGAGKTTTMRLILGLDYPSAGSVTVNGRPYAQLPVPMHEVGALLDAGAVPGGRTARTVRSEFTKIRSVRSTSWSLALLVLASAAWCVAYCLGTVHNWPTMSAQDRAGFDPAQSSVLGVALLGQLVIVVFGALMFTSEYATGTMRTSLTVMPRRTVFYGAKLATFAAVSLAVTVVASFGMFFLGQALLGSTHTAVSLAHPGVLRSVIITALYAEVCGLIAFGIGALARNTAAALTISYGASRCCPSCSRRCRPRCTTPWWPGCPAATPSRS